MNKIKCPFCGSEDWTVEEDKDEGREIMQWYVECNHCGARGSDAPDSEAQAISQWETISNAVEELNNETGKTS